MIIDQTYALARQGYRWARRLRAGRTAAPARLFGRPAVVVGGPDGVRRFYDDRLRRRAAFPPPIKLVLFGPGGVHGLDDREHHDRKALFVDLLERLGDLIARAEDAWQNAVDAWQPGTQRRLFELAVDTTARTVLPWSGLDVEDAEALRIGRRLARVVNGFMRPVRPYVQAVGDRIRLDRLAAELVRDVRSGHRDPAAGTALRAAARHEDHLGRLLPARIAGVEFLNIIRPTIASAWFVTFAGMALVQTGEQRRVADQPDFRTAFANEVRRHYPFVPILAAKTRSAQEVFGHRLPSGGLVILDVYGTNHDAAEWRDPQQFRPDRFLTDVIDRDAFVPQGGGDVRTGHRCPGEDVVVIMIEAALRSLASIPLRLPEQDLTWPVSPLPTQPRSGVLLSRIAQ